MLAGTHGPFAEGEVYVAGVDVAGQDEDARPGLLLPGNEVGGRDSTVVTIARISFGADRHTQHHTLRALLGETFPCVHVAVDATGLGAAVATWLTGALGEHVVESFVFGAASKSRLGFTLLAMAGTGRCRLYRRDGTTDSERMWHEVEKARYELRGEETMRFFVPVHEGHDDYLMSLALCCHAAQAAAPPAESAVIRPRREAYERW